MQRIEGGYLVIKTPFIRRGLNAHTAGLEQPIPQSVLDAVNVIQRTGWRVNDIVLRTATEAWRSGEQIAGLPSPEDLPTPPRIDDAVWEKMGPEEIVKHKTELAAVHGENARSQSIREEIIRKLQLAEEMSGRAFWHVHTIDFRGRCYPVTQDLHPQGDDLSKGLHEFHEGIALGPRGAFWLACRIGSNYGNGIDKMNFQKRFEWVKEHSEEIVSSAKDPLDGNRFWTTAEEPWQFLAGCAEWAEYMDKGAAFVSHLPVNLDGSINGAQHLSALGMDPIGARLTNMTPCPDRQDLYTDVCNICIERINSDVLNGVEEARHWVGKVTRSTVKRGVMTTPYGVTDRGLRDQLIQDKHTKGLEGSQVANANYFKNVLSDAIGQCVTGAKSIMAYLQDVAETAAEAELPFAWTGPLGMRVCQAYHLFNVNRIETVMGTFRLQEENAKLGLAKRKQALAASPNFVHHLDAMHLYRTVLRSREEGIKDFLVVHDSYGCHAAHMEKMSRFIREEFVALYQEDHLQNLANEYEAVGLKLPATPKKGTFDVREVLEAPFFFS
jgi:DNA-directed RNA polymerase